MVCMYAKSLQSHQTLCNSTESHQPPLFMGFSRQEYWSGLLCPPPVDLPDPGIKPTSLTSPTLANKRVPPVSLALNPLIKSWLRDLS